jgi:asparagine synthase (glutamine-hydrolysing)
MNGIAAYISWQAPAAARFRVEAMLARMAFRGEEQRIVLATDRAALGSVGPAGERAGTLDWPDLRCVADLRLDNRNDLKGVFGSEGGPELSDIDLLLLGYRRWGVQLAEHLAGDFAFVIWDGRHRSVYAARDPFGVRTLFYEAREGHCALASEIDTLVLSEGGPRELEEDVVLDYLLNDPRGRRETFYQGIRRVQPGHWLLAGAGSLREERYWKPPRWPLRLASGREYAAEFRRHFGQAVEARLDRARPTVAQLSGGLDSSSIVCMAEELYRRQPQRPPLYAASAVYPGLPCDESAYLNVLARKIRFPIIRWNARQITLLPNMDAAIGLAHPWDDAGSKEVPGDQRLALQVGARTVLSGFGGDQLLFEHGVYRDLAQQQRWLALVLDACARQYSSQGRLEVLSDALRGAVPASLRRLYREWRPAAVGAPDWLSIRLRERWFARDFRSTGDHRERFTSHCQEATWNWLTSPRFWWLLEEQVLSAARRGLEVRFPYLDSRLARLVLSVPYEFRLPAGRMKRLLRQAMRGLVPPAILNRRRITTFESMVHTHYPNSRGELQRVLAGAEWFSHPYLDRSGVQALFDLLATDCAHSPASWGAMCNLFDMAQLEVWLRGLHNSGVLQLQGAIH